jgi:hypothetical protein
LCDEENYNMEMWSMDPPLHAQVCICSGAAAICSIVIVRHLPAEATEFSSAAVHPALAP